MGYLFQFNPEIHSSEFALIFLKEIQDRSFHRICPQWRFNAVLGQIKGVFFAQCHFTVRAHEAGSHQGKGWEEFTMKSSGDF